MKIKIRDSWKAVLLLITMAVIAALIGQLRDTLADHDPNHNVVVLGTQTGVSVPFVECDSDPATRRIFSSLKDGGINKAREEAKVLARDGEICRNSSARLRVTTVLSSSIAGTGERQMEISLAKAEVHYKRGREYPGRFEMFSPPARTVILAGIMLEPQTDSLYGLQ